MKQMQRLNTVNSIAGTAADQPARYRAIALLLIGCVLMFLALELGTTWLTGSFDMTGSALITTIIMLGLALGLEKQFFNHSWLTALQALGCRRPRLPALVVVKIITLIMAAFLPLFAHVTGVHVSLRGDWWWLLIGVVALNGIAEE